MGYAAGEASDHLQALALRQARLLQLCAALVVLRDDDKPGGQQPDDKRAAAYDGSVLAPGLVDPRLGLPGHYDKGAARDTPKRQHPPLAVG